MDFLPFGTEKFVLLTICIKYQDLVLEEKFSAFVKTIQKY